MRGADVIHGSARRNRPFHCSVSSVYLTFYCRNIVWHLVLDDLWIIRGLVQFVNYNQRKRCESASVANWPYRNRDVAPLFASKESGFALPVHFDVRKSASNVLLRMKHLQMCAYCPDSRHVAYFIIHCQWLKLNVDFRGKSVQWSQTPSPLAYAVCTLS